MMQIENMEAFYVSSLQELRNMEVQALGALIEIAESVSAQELTASALDRRGEIEARCDKLDKIIERHNADPTKHVDQTMTAIVTETKKMAKSVAHPIVRDVGIIDSLRRMEHYAMASYASVALAANHLGLREDEEALSNAVAESKEADRQLERLARLTAKPTLQTSKRRENVRGNAASIAGGASYPFIK
jgi:Mn-containing catalase